MGKNHFTEEQLNELGKNPYIQKVSVTSITYTTEFKERFEEEYRAGKLPSQILVDMGINPHVLGKARRKSLVQRIKMYESRPEGFGHNRTGRSDRCSLID